MTSKIKDSGHEHILKRFNVPALLPRQGTGKCMRQKIARGHLPLFKGYEKEGVHIQAVIEGDVTTYYVRTYAKDATWLVQGLLNEECNAWLAQEKLKGNY